MKSVLIVVEPIGDEWAEGVEDWGDVDIDTWRESAEDYLGAAVEEHYQARWPNRQIWVRIAHESEWSQITTLEGHCYDKIKVIEEYCGQDGETASQRRRYGWYLGAAEAGAEAVAKKCLANAIGDGGSSGIA